MLINICYINHLKAVVLFYDSGEFFILSLAYLQTDEFDLLWKKISDGHILPHQLISINPYSGSKSFNNSGLFGTVKDVS